MLWVAGQTADRTQVAGILLAAGYQPVRMEYRDFPSITGGEAQSWHHEGPHVPGCGKVAGRVAFWSNEPTEFRVCETGEPIPVEPDSVVVIDNAKVEHRMPLEYTTARQFARAWIAR